MGSARSACPLDCPDACTLEVEVRDAAVVRVGAAPAGPTTNPATAGFICAKVRRGLVGRVHGPARVTTPLRRIGPKGEGRFASCTWDEALDLVADRVRWVLDERGPAAVVPYLYSSSAGAVARNGLGRLLWAALGVTEVDATICAATAGEAWERTFGDLPPLAPQAIEQAGAVVVWGANPSVSGIHLVPFLDRLAARGGRLAVVDPRRTGTAHRADLHLAPLPGTDVVLALAVIARLEELGLVDRELARRRADGVDEVLEAARQWGGGGGAAVAGVDAADIDAFARLLGGPEPVVVQLGLGLERHRHGGDAHRAVMAMTVLAGQVGRPGAGLLAEVGGRQALSFTGFAEAVLGGPPPPPARVLRMHRIGHDLLAADPPVELLFVQGANPAVTAPNQGAVLAGLAREDLFCVVHEQVLTDTARFADVVLPAPTSLEMDDLVTSYGFTVQQWADAVVPRVGEARTNDEVALGLAARLGVDLGAARTPADLSRLLGGRASVADPLVDLEPEPVVPFLDVLPGLPDGRARLAPAPEWTPTDDGWPLALLSPAGPHTVNSIFGEPGGPGAGRAAVHLHPDDAADRGIEEGHQVRVANDLGSLTCEARLDHRLRRGVATMPKGLWCHELAEGRSTNVLVPDHVADLASGACFNDTRVEITPVRSAP
ncbi:MAG: molybdopterin-dependent oxidoreductase [Acidimicrobiales bacterium]|nr:molybdopterin-dependent oxidoreductase [Acidimicrobiales bacterium]